MTEREKALNKLRLRVTDDRDAAIDGALAVVDHADINDRNGDELEGALARIETHGRRLAALPDFKVKSEPDLYARGSEHSFFKDMVAASDLPLPLPNVHPHDARDRLDRHSAYEATQKRSRDTAAARGASDYGIQPHNRSGQPVQERALSMGDPAAGGVAVPPKWITSEFASAARAAAPLRRLVRTIDLPGGCDELHIPRANVVAGIVPINEENTIPMVTMGKTDALVAPVCCISGILPLSQQLYERGNFDAIATPDFGEAYAAALQQQLVNGTGTNGQLLGLLNVSTTDVSPDVRGATLNTYTDASPTTAKIVNAIAQTAALGSDKRERAHEFVLLRPSRYFWLAGSPDGSGNEPTQRPGTGYLTDKAPEDGPFGPIAGLPAYLDATIPNDFGSGGNQDAAITCRGRDIILLEDQPHFTTLVDHAGGPAQLNVAIEFHIYVAAFTNRYPSSVGWTTGTGWTAPAGWSA